MKSVKSNNKLAIDLIEFNNETTKLRNDVQCLIM